MSSWKAMEYAHFLLELSVALLKFTHMGYSYIREYAINSVLACAPHPERGA